jgi:hypothetical protein
MLAPDPYIYPRLLVQHLQRYFYRRDRIHSTARAPITSDDRDIKTRAACRIE